MDDPIRERAPDPIRVRADQALIRYGSELVTRWSDLFAEHVDDSLSDAAISMTFNLMWGLAMEEAASSYMEGAIAQMDRLPIEIRTEMLLDAIEGMLERDRG